MRTGIVVDIRESDEANIELHATSVPFVGDVVQIIINNGDKQALTLWLSPAQVDFLGKTCDAYCVAKASQDKKNVDTMAAALRGDEPPIERGN